MWPGSRPYLLVLPACLVIAVLFIGGIIQGLAESVGVVALTGPSSFTLQAYHNLLGAAEFWGSLFLTFRIALLSTVIASLTGALGAITLHAIGKSVSTTSGLFRRGLELPLLVPHLASAYLMALLLMQSGWLSRFTYQLGWIKEINSFPVMINEPFGWGILLTYVWKETPFIILMLYPVLVRIDTEWQEVARVLGAGRWAYWRSIVLPLLLPAWMTAAFIVFAFTFSAFEVPYLLGVTYPKLLPVFSYQLYTSGALVQRPEALAINVILAVVIALLGVVVLRMVKYLAIGKGGGW